MSLATSAYDVVWAMAMLVPLVLTVVALVSPLVLMLASAVGFLLATVIAVTRERRRRD